jgi:hypothetical protein
MEGPVDIDDGDRRGLVIIDDQIPVLQGPIDVFAVEIPGDMAEKPA